MKSILKISLQGWSYFQQCCLKFLFKQNFCLSHMIFMYFMNALDKPLLNSNFLREGTMCIMIH